MEYTLIRLNDNKVITGTGSDSIAFKKDGTFKKAYKERPKLKCSLVIGRKLYDWWQTTIVTEILFETDTYCRFKTTNSEYIWIKKNTL